MFFSEGNAQAEREHHLKIKIEYKTSKMIVNKGRGS